MLYEMSSQFLPCEYRCKIAAERWELDGYWRLRREVFCSEQGLFEADDADDFDRSAFPIVAVSLVMGMPDRVVGTVRIDERDAGTWYGSRLTVHPDFRGVARLGTSLIWKAVSSAHAMGCKRFLAMVQAQNVPFFRRLHWKTLDEAPLLGRPHHLMEAALNWYRPSDPSIPMEVAPVRRAS